MILVFGATGFTGRMVVSNLVDLGLPVRIAARSEEKLRALAERHGGLEYAVADVEDPASLDAACEGVKVLVTTVGPYTWWGHVAAEAAIRNKVAYIDITGEPAFVRRVFDEWGPPAAAAGTALLTAFGYDYVPGNLAGALALDRAGDHATRVDIGYFLTGGSGRNLKNFSQGTLSSLRASSSATQFRFHNGQIEEERAAKHVFEFDMRGKHRTAISIGSTEALALPRTYPQLRDVNVGLGWFAKASRAVSVISAVGEAANKIPPVKKLMDLTTRPIKIGGGHGGTSGKAPAGPDEASQQDAETMVFAVARDSAGAALADVIVRGPNPYPLTGATVAWACQQILDGKVAGTGALGPVEAFGLDALREGCAGLGLREVGLREVGLRED